MLRVSASIKPFSGITRSYVEKKYVTVCDNLSSGLKNLFYVMCGMFVCFILLTFYVA